MEKRKYITITKQITCKGKPHLNKMLTEITSQEGEGVMLKDPKSVYDFKRSKYLQKVKVFHDAEAKVVGYQEGTGRLQGQLGAYLCEDAKSRVGFKVGSGFNDAQRNWSKKFKIGTVITYKYFEINKDSGVPRFPTFLRLYKPA